MDWGSVAKQLATFAPGLGAAVGGPIGGAVGLGVKAVCEFFGIDSDSDDAADQVDAALRKMTPEQAIELKKVDNDFIVKMKKLDIDVFALEVDDKKSAREREKAVGSLDNRVLAFLIVGGFLGMVFGVLSGLLSGVNGVLAGTLIGYVSAKAEQVVSYYFGSSMGSKQKTDAMERIVKK